ncbi:MAG: hypothetical protein B7Z55_19300 [Planctomycetales bacterium 12-60-4]|nr:MAG: hypothetical protein B7Z55_19300 [Planctomycetales bacterium 12-60-4]
MHLPIWRGSGGKIILIGRNICTGMRVQTLNKGCDFYDRRESRPIPHIFPAKPIETTGLDSALDLTNRSSAISDRVGSTVVMKLGSAKPREGTAIFRFTVWMYVVEVSNRLRG